MAKKLNFSIYTRFFTPPTNEQFIVRETSLVKDESLDLCQTITLANFGLNEKASQETADLLNSK